MASRTRTHTRMNRRGAQPRQPRIKDIAEKLGVSIATVSRALNDRPGVAPEMRQKVLELAAELRFAPHAAARSLSGERPGVDTRTGVVCFVVHQHDMPVASDPFYYIILRGAERALAREGYHVMVTTVDDQMEARAEGLRVVRERRVDGLIMAGPDLEPALVLSVLHDGLPVVLVDNTLERTPVDCVMCDNYEGARTAVEHLLWHGHRRIAFVGGPVAWVSTREREAGYSAAMAEAGLPATALHESATTVATGLRAGRQLFVGVPDDRRPTAVFAVNDATALGVIRAAREAGLRVPQDVAVVGFDDINMAELTDPPLTTVHIPKELMGELAARHLLDLIEGRRQMPVKSIVATTLVVRASCGCALHRERG